MKQLLTGKQMKQADTWSIKEFGMESLILMERAALCAAQHIMSVQKPGCVFIMCGMGNNGADGRPGTLPAGLSGSCQLGRHPAGRQRLYRRRENRVLGRLSGLGRSGPWNVSDHCIGNDRHRRECGTGRESVSGPPGFL